MSKRWTKSDEKFLRENYQNMTNKELAKKFGVTTISVQRKLSRIGLIRQIQKKWNSNEEEFLAKNYKELDDSEMAKQFNVSTISIKRKLNRLGLHRDNKRKNTSKKIKTTSSQTSPKTAVKKKSKTQEKVKTANIIKYRIDEVYNVGDVILHSLWKEKGVVKRKYTTQGGFSAIEVEFEKSGLKSLIEGYKE